MTKREKVIKWLAEEAVEHEEKEIRDLAHTALLMLEEQEPRVMTLEEVKQHDNQDGCVWFEQPTYNAVAAFVRQDEECTEIISPYLLGEPINHGYMYNTFYAKAWRA